MSPALFPATAVLGTTLLLVVATAGRDAPGGFRVLVVLVPVVAIAAGSWLRSVGTSSAGLLGAATVVAAPLSDRVVSASEAALWAVALVVVVEVSLRAARPPAPPPTAVTGRVRAATPILVAIAAAPATAAVVAWVTRGGRLPQMWAVVALVLVAGLLALVRSTLAVSSQES